MMEQSDGFLRSPDFFCTFFEIFSVYGLKYPEFRLCYNC